MSAPNVTWTGGAIVYAPLHGGPPIGSDVLGIDANLSQYTSPAITNIACLDVNGTVLWSLEPDDIQQLFFDAGASVVVSGAAFCQAMLSPDGQHVLFFAQWADPTDSAGHQSMFVGISPISAVGAVAAPVLTNYLRLHNAGSAGTFYRPCALHEMTDGDGVQTSLVLEALNLTLTPPTVFIYLPTVAELIAGTYKGSHPGCMGTLGADQGPVFQVSWNNSTSVYAADSSGIVHAGTVDQNGIGFLLNVGGDQRFYMVTPRGWMDDPGSLSGFKANWSGTYPHGAAFYLDFNGYSTYAAHTWTGTTITDEVSLTSDAIDITATGFLDPGPTPAIPWPDEFTRILDEGPNEGWIATYLGRPVILNRGANPSVLFPILDGNPDYATMIGAGQRVYYSRVRNYVWNTDLATFVAVNDAEGIVLRQGDLGESNFIFSNPGSQLLAAYDGKLYFQIIEQAGAKVGSLLTQFGAYAEPPGLGRAVMVRSVIGPRRLTRVALQDGQNPGGGEGGGGGGGGGGPPTDSASASITVGTAANRQLVSDSLAQVLTFPAANTVSVTKSIAGAGLVEMTRGAVFNLAPTLMGPPAAAYTGVEGSGWNGTRPTQPAITTTAPAIRFITMPNKRFTGTWDVVAIADDPSVIASVDWMVEGTTVNQTTQSFVYYTDVNGLKRKVYGYAIRLTASNYTGLATDKTRGIEVYCRANPVDGTWQARVIGAGATGATPSRAQRHFLVPATRQYGAKIQVKPSQGAASVFFTPATPGVDVEAIFNTFQDAVTYAQGLTTNTSTGAVCASANCGVNIEIAENCTIEMVDGSFGSKNAVRAYYVISLAAGVTLVTWRKTGITGWAVWYPGQYGMEWAGVGHVFDHTHFADFASSPSNDPDRYWWRANGIGQDTCAWDMFDHLDDLGNPRNPSCWHEVEDCDFLKWHHSGAQHQLNIIGGFVGSTWRNYTTRGLSSDDIDNGMQASYGGRIITATADPFRTVYPLLNIKYTGSATSGSITYNGNVSTVVTFKDHLGSTVGTITLLSTWRAADFVAAINNTGPGGSSAIAAAFTATGGLVTPGDQVTDRLAINLDDGNRHQNNAMGTVAVAGSASSGTVFYSFIDIHMDDYQSAAGTAIGGLENVVRVDRQAWGFQGIQTKFYDYTAISFLDRNQFYDNNVTPALDVVFPQVAQVKHLRMLNVSDARSTVIWGDGDATGSGWTDAYTRAESLVYGGSAWKSTGSITAVPTFTDSYFNTYSNPSPGTASGVVSGLGDYTTLYPGLSTRDPRPAGALLTHKITPRFAYDAWGVEGGSSNVMGAKYLPPDLSSITGAEAAELAVVALGADTCTYTIAGRTGAGNTGTLLTLTLNVTAVDN